MKPRVVIIGLGPSGPELITTGSLARLQEARHLFVRTMRHPAAVVLNRNQSISFDHVYDDASSVGKVYETIVENLVEAATTHGEVTYAVPGSPAVAEHTVELLLRDERVTVEVLPALSFIDLAWVRLGIDPVNEAVQIVDGQNFEAETQGTVGPYLVSQCDTKIVLSDIKLSVEEPPEGEVTVLYHLGLSDEALFSVAWEDLDRSFEPDHLTSLWIPKLPVSSQQAVQAFVEVVQQLRNECVWDQEQTHTSLSPYLLDETYEVLEVLDQAPGDEADPASFEAFYQMLEEELGDLLYQIVFHSLLASEEGYFTFSDVATGIRNKLMARNPQVFGLDNGQSVDLLGGFETVEAQETRWELIKAQEKARDSIFDGIVATLPALVLATQIETKAGRANLTLPTTNTNETAERLLSLVVEATANGVDLESALRTLARQREQLYRQIEAGRDRQ